ncbi:unnamed protein product [Acidocella sp. C78]|nr:unnamed protein product [Acidocella sp. C78]
MNEIVRLVMMTGGLLAVMPVLLLVTLVVGLERFWLLKRTLGAGRRIHAALRAVGYGNPAGLRDLAESHGTTLQATSSPPPSPRAGRPPTSSTTISRKRSWMRCRESPAASGFWTPR